MTDGVTMWDQKLDSAVTHRKRHPALWFVVIVLVFGIAIAMRIFERYYAEQPF